VVAEKIQNINKEIEKVEKQPKQKNDLQYEYRASRVQVLLSMLSGERVKFTVCP